MTPIVDKTSSDTAIEESWLRPAMDVTGRDRVRIGYEGFSTIASSARGYKHRDVRAVSFPPDPDR
jgi:hypothetical protein